MSQIAVSPTFSIINNRPVVSSLDVAEHFCKTHSHVLRTVRQIALECPLEFNESNFGLVEYADAKGEMRPMYQLSRDGFTLLAMGFAGKKAMQWKIKYIEAFNAMEKALLEKAQNSKTLPKQISLPAIKADTRRQIDGLYAKLKMVTREAFDIERDIFMLARDAIKPSLKTFDSKRTAMLKAYATHESLSYAHDRILEALVANVETIMTIEEI